MLIVIDPPEYSPQIKAKHVARVTTVHAQQNNMLAAHQATKAAIEQSITANLVDAHLLLELTKVDNDIIQLEFDIGQDVDVHLFKKEKVNIDLMGRHTRIESTN